MKRFRWYVRPDETFLHPKTGRPIAANHAVPRFSYQLQHAHTATEQLVYDGIVKRSRDMKNGNGRKLRQVSIAQLGRELKMPESTVRDCLRSLVRKHSLVQWREETGTAERRIRGDFGGVTTWMVPTWQEGLEARRADPLIGTVAGKSGIPHCYVIGKGKRFLTPAEIVAWKVDAVVAREAGLAAAARGATVDEIDVVLTGPSEARPPGSFGAQAPSLPETGLSPGSGSIDPQPKVVDAALRATIRKGGANYSNQTVKGLVKRARALAASHGEPLSDFDIANAIYAAAKNAKGPVGTIGFYDRALPEKLEAMFEARARERDARRDAAAAEPPPDPTKCWTCVGTGKDFSGQPQDPHDNAARVAWAQAGIPDCPECGGTGLPAQARATA